MQKESSGGVGEPLTTNQSIVRQVLYKCTAEVILKGAPVEEFNKYAKELEKGFYEEK